MTAVFETDRLELRQFSVADAAGFYALNADPEVLRYTGDVPFATVAEAEAFIRDYRHYDRCGYGRWSVFLKETGEYIGFCGLNHRAAANEVDVGFRFLRKHWGKGYATEAARASLAHGFSVYGLDRIVARAMKDNLASHRVLQKLGMQYVRDFDMDEAVWSLYEMRSEWFSLPGDTAAG